MKIAEVKSYYSKKTDAVYVINFWATFCKPCIAEIPYLQSISKKYESKKVKLLLVSLDLPVFFPDKIRSFAKKNNFTADIAWLNESDADYFCPVIDKKWSGSIPATLFVNAATGYKMFVENEMSNEQFESELKMAIAGKKVIVK
ncbi:MAG: TlpA disulfide reductase family protein [Ferruginibacter sp.]